MFLQILARKFQLRVENQINKRTMVSRRLEGMKKLTWVERKLQLFPFPEDHHQFYCYAEFFNFHWCL